jgi:hypothetical protein
MTKRSDKRIVPPLILKELEVCGLEWTLVEGKKHYKIYVAGRFCDILPKTQADPPRMNLKIRAHIRRFVREIKGSQADAVDPH